MEWIYGHHISEGRTAAAAAAAAAARLDLPDPMDWVKQTPFGTETKFRPLDTHCYFYDSNSPFLLLLLLLLLGEKDRKKYLSGIFPFSFFFFFFF